MASKLDLPANELLELRRVAADEDGPIPAGEDGLGQPIGQWDPHDLEVHPAGTFSVSAGSGARSRRKLPGYVRRAHDEVVTEVVGQAAAGHSRMLVLVGSSLTGKTRACWEAVQPLADLGWRLWHPHDPTRAEASLADLDRVAPRTVVWLNEAQHYLGHPQYGERIAAALHTLLTRLDRRPVLVLGTLWRDYADTYARLPDSRKPDPHSRVRELLSGRTVTVPDVFSREELDQAAYLAQSGDQVMADTLTRARVHGRLAQDLAGAPELLRRYEQGTAPVRALLEAAMDARRLGVGLHLRQAFLFEASADYFKDQDCDQRTDDWAEAAFADLARPVHGKQAPLRRTTARPPRRPPGTPVPATIPGVVAGSAFRLADFLEQYGRTNRRRVCPPVSFWHAVYTHLTDADDLNTLAEAAYMRCRLQWAYHLWHRASHAGHPKALAQMAQMREQAGDREGAEALLRQAADADAGFSLHDLAQMREEAGDREGAEALARRDADRGFSFTLENLVRVREAAGDRDGAEGLLQRAADAGHVFALRSLALMREQAGDREGAKGLLQRAADAGDSIALGGLAQMSEEAGDREDAEFLAWRAADADNPLAVRALALMREQAGDRVGAEALAWQAADAGDAPTIWEVARLRKGAGDQEGAERLLRQVVDAGYPEALTWLALMREETGDRDGAEALMRQAYDVGNEDAEVHLSLMRGEAGDRDEAEALAWRVADTGNSAALQNLLRFWKDAADREGAEAFALRVADAGFASSIAVTSWWPNGLDPDGSPTPDVPWRSDSR
ncbi:SEL1-like repeat protein [Amycolatopsis sp. NBC_00438]|uniref:SEL1-like repeat protein n=1 Tax=Amycolatopsis sp. NBC_00438 TaxID=2903558 RepID=UPI002E241FE7